MAERDPGTLVGVGRALSAAVSGLSFAPPVTHVYNPLDYARAANEQYIERYARRPEAVLLGMNPGPWGMAQTGVPFGEVSFVRDWMGIDAPIGRPSPEHPKRPVRGLACPRSEVSGARLWGWAKSRYGTPDAFFERFFVWNWCPLSFMEASGKNRVPEKLPAEERASIEAPCDEALRRVVALLRPRIVIGVGAFAEERAREALTGVEFGRIPHPSPASPAANKDWDGQTDRALAALGLAS